MKKVISLLLFFLLSIICTGQKVYVTNLKYDANTQIKKVYVSDLKYNANEFVYLTNVKAEARKTGFWFITHIKAEADLIIYYTKVKAEADWIIYFTKVKAEAGIKSKTGIRK